MLFPYYRDKVLFAALSLDGTGLTSYGNCSIVLKDVAIQSRATVFEENSIEFIRSRHLGVGSPIPPGYRATWTQRDMLATAKLGPRLRAGMTVDEFARTLLNPETMDFIEVHVYGSVHRLSIERLIVSQPFRKFDEPLLRQMEVVLRSSEPSVILEVRR